MAKKEFLYRGKTLEELQQMGLDEILNHLKARQRRKLKRGLNENNKNLMKKIISKKKNVRTHSRDMIILPEMVGAVIKVHKGNQEWVDVDIQPEMIGHYLGEFAMTRKKVAHNAPGIGATKSSAGISVK